MPDDIDPPQCHHKIPHDNAKFDHWKHKLTEWSGVNLTNEPRNKTCVYGHNGRHGPIYNQNVQDRMNIAWSSIPGKNKLSESELQAAAQAQIFDVMNTIGNDIKSGTLALHTNRSVEVPNPDDECKTCLK